MNDNDMLLPRAEPMEVVKQVVVQLFGPLGEMVSHNTEAMQRVAAVMKVQNDRLETLERQIRLQSPVSAVQARYLNEAIRHRAESVLQFLTDPYQPISSAKATTRLAGAIRHAVLIRYGIPALRDLPKCEYSVALSQVEMWNDVLTIHKVYMEFAP